MCVCKGKEEPVITMCKVCVVVGIQGKCKEGGTKGTREGRMNNVQGGTREGKVHTRQEKVNVGCGEGVKAGGKGWGMLL